MLASRKRTPQVSTRPETRIREISGFDENLAADRTTISVVLHAGSEVLHFGKRLRALPAEVHRNIREMPDTQAGARREGASAARSQYQASGSSCLRLAT